MILPTNIQNTGILVLWQPYWRITTIFNILTIYKTILLFMEESKMNEAVVQRQLQAYNDKNIDLFMACYSEDVKIYDFPHTLTMDGQEAMRERYHKLFATYPNMIATVDKRIFHGKYVIDHEEITGRLEGAIIQAVAMYEIKDDLITKVWFLRGD
jgi:hypothetical protein